MKTGFREHIGASVLFMLAISIVFNRISDQVFLLASFIFIIREGLRHVRHSG